MAKNSTANGTVNHAVNTYYIHNNENEWVLKLWPLWPLRCDLGANCMRCSNDPITGLTIIHLGLAKSEAVSEHTMTAEKDV
jgi:hypothetical protein